MYPPNSPDQDRDDLLPEWREPFPHPQTIPSGWDLSGSIPDPEEVAALEADSSSEV